jgi:hypothetical protein
MGVRVVRDCGTCTMCCKSATVQELEKPGGVWCKHCKIGDGCSIYEDRPHGCRVYNCLWLYRPDLLPHDWQRPDRLGVVFSLTNMPSVTGDPTGEKLKLFTDEAKHGAFEKKTVKRTRAALAEGLKYQVASPTDIERALSEEAAGHGLTRPAEAP